MEALPGRCARVGRDSGPRGRAVRWVRLAPVCGWFFFFQAEDGIRDVAVTGVQTCALPICRSLPLCTQLELDQLAASADARLSFILAAQSNRGVRRVDVPIRAGCAPAEVPELLDRKSVV